MSTIIDAGESEDSDLDPPTNENGQYVCGRPCTDGSRCMAHVSFGYMTCYQHDRSQPIVREDDGRGDRREREREDENDGVEAEA